MNDKVYEIEKNQQQAPTFSSLEQPFEKGEIIIREEPNERENLATEISKIIEEESEVPIPKNLLTSNSQQTTLEKSKKNENSRAKLLNSSSQSPHGEQKKIKKNISKPNLNINLLTKTQEHTMESALMQEDEVGIEKINIVKKASKLNYEDESYQLSQ